MKITKRELRRIIKEEKARLLSEQKPSEMSMHDAAEYYENQRFEGSMMDLDDHNELLSQIERMIHEFKRKGYTQEDEVHAISEALGEFR